MKSYDHSKIEKKWPQTKLRPKAKLADFVRGKQKAYNHLKIEKKWQKVWERDKLGQASNKSKKPKFYVLIEFPYPSGDGLHVGHIRSNTAMDIIARKRRAEGFEVLYPIGWDAFGLPTENYAIKTGIQPAVVTKKNTDTFRKQLKSLGFSFDWSREINTTDPAYYKWTQWLFLKFLEQGLAYKAKMAINWCPKDKIGLANEEVVDGRCERCGTPVEKREKEQWMLAITKYAERLDKDLDDVNYLPRIKTQQRNWIGKSEGAEIDFKIKDSNETIKVFTTRPDTIFGATYLVLAPEHELISKLKSQISNDDEVLQYTVVTKKKADIERTAEGKTKTGVELKGLKAINPASGEEISIWIADYVLASYGTGAIMAVPAHDERDFEFAEKYELPVREVIEPDEARKEFLMRHMPKQKYYIGSGKLKNSGDFDGKKSLHCQKEITEFVKGKWVTRFKLRDWVFSRQRYWGEPIPVVHCEKCGIVPLPEKDLPLELPKVKNYQPTDTGESPLASIDSWVNTKCPKCKGPAKRETDTMPNWAGSSWYFLRYVDVNNKKEFANADALKYWMPVDWYNGGMEHTTLHLLYSRFWNKFLFDLKLVPTSEPYMKRTSHGLILAESGEKMSKSKGNVINPDGIVKIFGADTLRVYEMFMGPFDQPIAWSTDSMVGPRRFLEKIWRLKELVNPKTTDSAGIISLLHKTIEKVGLDIEAMSFNTAISSLMIFVNELEKQTSVSEETYETLLRLIAPFAPHITEELWNSLGHKKSIHIEVWPKFDVSKTNQGKVKIVVQIGGKTRAVLEAERGLQEAGVKERAMKLEEVQKWTLGKHIRKVIYVPDRLINLVLDTS